MDNRTDGPRSPSARFYANRQSEGTRIFDMLPHPDPEQEPRPQLSFPFSHFQGFSAPPSSHRYINNTGAACMPDERVSPRTVITYHDHQNWEPPRQRMEQLSNENEHMPSTGYGSPNHCVGLVHTHNHNHSLSVPGGTRQLSEPLTYITPPPQYVSSPENAPTPAFAERPVAVILPPRGAPTGPLPIAAQHPVLGGNTIRAPSSSDASDAGQQPQGLAAVGRPLTANEKGESTSVSSSSSSSSDDDANSTIYPYGSTCAASSSTASRTAGGGGGVSHRPLELAIVEVHNTCLAATQRYLELLRVNWELRHGCETLTPPGLAGPTRRPRDRTVARGSPYSLLRRTRRALSENSGLEYMRGDEGDAGEEGGIHGRQSQPPACPIPAPTDSLLQNTSRICELIWRRARRDRDDVLGAEVFGTRRMGLLVECAEAVVLHDAGEWEEDLEGVFFTACQAGRNFCRELGDLRGVGRVESIERGEIQLGRSVEEGEV